MHFMDGVFITSQSSEWPSMLFALSVKSILMVAAAAALTFILRSASARLRHWLWCSALTSLLVLPLFTGRLEPLDVPILPSGFLQKEAGTERAAQIAGEEPAIRDAANFRWNPDPDAGQSAESNAPQVEPQQPPSGFSWSSIILLGWLTGALLVFGRFLVGVVTVRRLVARATELTDAEWSELSSELSQQIQLRRCVRLLRSDESIMPMTCIGISPVVLLPNDADRWPADRRRVVVLHELIHIKRRDLLTQTLSQIVCSLYWFNPLVWWAAARLRIEQEWACDEHVMALGIEGPDYAAHLLAVARKFQADAWQAPATTAMARPSRLEERLGAILKPARGRYRSAPVIAVSVFIMSVVFISAAVTRLVTAERQKDRTDVLSRIDDAAQDGQNESEPLPGNRQATVADARAVPVSQDIHAVLRQIPSPTPINPAADQPSAISQDAGDETAEQAFDGFSQEERRRLMSNGIGPAYIEEMQEAGYRQLTAAELIALFSNGVRANYVARLGAMGYGRLSTSDLLSLKTNGITPEVIKSFQAVKHADFKATNYGSLVSNGVTPSYIRSLNDAGYDYLTANKIIGMRLAGITPDFIRDARSRGNTNLSPNELIELKRSGNQ